jgi:lipopolysaccharide/colanic/teichoic acid biosynthesis glycosyltransferase
MSPLLPEGVPISKRALDLILTVPGVIVLAPFLAILALLVRIVHGKPVLFRQMRPGYRGRPFYVYKFRSMSEKRDVNGALLPDEDRLTPLGRFLRATSLDELPELLNVLRGEMSLVGPRPLLMQYLELYSSEQARRHDVLPGITGWAQINGRNILSWEDKFQLDVWYVDNRSVWLDIKILAITLWKVIRREGIDQPGYISSEEFMGSEADASLHKTEKESHTGAIT